MGQRQPGSARTAAAVRRAIRQSQESRGALAGRYGIAPKTVAKGKPRPCVHDAPMGPKDVRSTLVNPAEAAMAVAFRRQTRLPREECLSAAQPSLPHPTRSSLRRCRQSHHLSRLPDTAGDTPRKTFKPYPIGYVHIGIAEVRTEAGELYLFVAIDRTSKSAYAA